MPKKLHDPLECQAVQDERDRFREALERIYYHTDTRVAPGTPLIDTDWIRAVTKAALYPKPKG